MHQLVSYIALVSCAAFLTTCAPLWIAMIPFVAACVLAFPDGLRGVHS